MDTKKYISDLFSEYENSENLNDFKEELETNLKERISYLKCEKLSEQEAWDKATGELADISEIAEALSLKKKKEVYKQMYMKTVKYISIKRMFIYVLLGGIFVFGVISAALAWLYSGEVIAGLGSLIPFMIFPVSGFVFMGLTQETAVKNPMSWKKALVYALASAVILFGLIIFCMMFFIDGTGLPEAIATLIPFVLPGTIILIFLILTEKNYQKPWVVEQQSEYMKQYSEIYADPKKAAKRGLLSGSLWIFAFALFVTLGVLISFKYSWLVFLFALGFQVLIEYLIIDKE